MSTEKKKKPRPDKYEKKVVVNGSFLDIMKAAVKHADKNTETKKP